jgi:CheY-like chemotaxis protein
MANNENESALRVTILDDDPLDVKLLQDALQASMNCRVTAVDSKPALLLNLWKELPDVVISDTNIPGFSGLKALELMQSLHPDIPFVICSGRDSPEVRAKALAAGAKAWVPKSDLQHLVTVVNQVRGSPGAETPVV